VQNPAHGAFEISYLEPLSIADCEDMIRTLGSRVNLEYSKEAIDLIYQNSGGYPFIARQICSIAFTQMRQGGEMPLELLEKIIEEFTYDPDRTYLLDQNGLWGALTQPAVWGKSQARAQGELLCFLAAEPDSRPIAEFYQGKSVAAKRAAARMLANLSIIKESAPGYFDISFGCFKSWVSAWQL
jgi:hypothetical protein